MPPTRVLRIIARMNVGGPAVQVTGLMRNLASRGFEQVLLTGYCAEDEADYLETQAPDVCATRIRGLGRAVKATDDTRALKSLVDHIREFRPDIVHTHTAKAGVLGRVAAKLSGKRPKVVHTYHGHLLHGYFSPAKTRGVIELERMLARGTDKLVAVGPQVRDDLLDARIGTPDKYAVVPPGLELAATLPKTEARQLLGLGDEPVVAFIGRITGIKRPDRFAEVTRLAKTRNLGITFLVAGNGDQAAALEQAVRDDDLPVRMLGWRSDVELILAASDAVILTSDNEGTPVSLIQAALAGLPVVATNVGSVKDVVVDGETGWLVGLTPEDLVAGLQDWLQSPQLGTARGLAAQERATRLYGVQRLAADYAGIYRELTGEAQP